MIEVEIKKNSYIEQEDLRKAVFKILAEEPLFLDLENINEEIERVFHDILGEKEKVNFTEMRGVCQRFLNSTRNYRNEKYLGDLRKLHEHLKIFFIGLKIRVYLNSLEIGVQWNTESLRIFKNENFSGASILSEINKLKILKGIKFPEKIEIILGDNSDELERNSLKRKKKKHKLIKIKYDEF